MRSGRSRRLGHRACNFSSAFRWSGAAVITALDVLAVLYLQNKGFRYIEALVITLIAHHRHLLCGGIDLFQAESRRRHARLRSRTRTSSRTRQMLYVSIGIIGATVMPHNLYLHSSIVQTRKFEQTPEGKREAIKFATIDSSGALMFALFINAAILDPRGGGVSLVGTPGRGGNPRRLQTAQPAARRGRRQHSLRRRAARLGTKLHAHRHAGRPGRDGRFPQYPDAPWLRRLITRALAIVPAVLVIGFFGEGKTTQLLIASQVVLSMQLGFAVWPLMRFTDEKAKMGEFVNPLWMRILGWTTAAIIIVLNVKLLFDTFMPDAVLKAFTVCSTCRALN